MKITKQDLIRLIKEEYDSEMAIGRKGQEPDDPGVATRRLRNWAMQSIKHLESIHSHEVPDTLMPAIRDALDALEVLGKLARETSLATLD
jgi:hypothetical protein